MVLNKTLIRLAGLFSTAGFAFAAVPAMAQDEAALIAAAATTEATSTAALTDADEQFQQLFSRWEALDVVNAPAPAENSYMPANDRPLASVSVPSLMPLQNPRMSSGYGMRTHPVLGRRRRHNGVDLAAPSGTPIYATADGVVSRANRFSSYGLYIAIEHGGEIQTRFAHLSRIKVRAGQKIRKGDLIGHVGSTGRSTGPHLHYEVRIAGKSVDPTPYMTEGGARRAYALVRGSGGQGGR